MVKIKTAKDLAKEKKTLDEMVLEFAKALEQASQLGSEAV